MTSIENLQTTGQSQKNDLKEYFTAENPDLTITEENLALRLEGDVFYSRSAWSKNILAATLQVRKSKQLLALFPKAVLYSDELAYKQIWQPFLASLPQRDLRLTLHAALQESFCVAYDPLDLDEKPTALRSQAKVRLLDLVGSYITGQEPEIVLLLWEFYTAGFTDRPFSSPSAYHQDYPSFLGVKEISRAVILKTLTTIFNKEKPFSEIKDYLPFLVWLSQNSLLEIWQHPFIKQLSLALGLAEMDFSSENERVLFWLILQKKYRIHWWLVENKQNIRIK